MAWETRKRVKWYLRRNDAYRRAYKNAIKMAQNILHQKVGKSYETFYGNQLSYEDFIINNPVDK